MLICGSALCTAGWAAGILDLSFDAGSGLNGLARAITIQPDGKMLIGGDFTTVAGYVRHKIARLNSDGTGDPSFDPGAGANDRVNSVVLQPDGKLLVAGAFTEMNGISRKRVARLNSDGSLDESFNPGAGADDAIESAVLQPDGKILIGGHFGKVNGVIRSRVARLNIDGSLDFSFNPTVLNSQYSGAVVYSMVVQPDGKILIGGSFISVNGVNLGGVARLNADGTLDNAFNPGTGISGAVKSIAVEPDGGVLVGGRFSAVNGIQRQSVARLFGNGSLDASFVVSVLEEVDAILLQVDGKIVIGGGFGIVNGISRQILARLNPDGTLDKSVDTHISLGPISPGFSALAMDASGNFIISGGFASINGVARSSLARLHADGTLDSSLNPSSGISGGLSRIFSVAIQPDGKVLAAGNFTAVGNSSRGSIARFETNGALDMTFDPGLVLDNVFGSALQPMVNSIVPQPDGRVIRGGKFSSIGGVLRTNLARLNGDGSVDLTFNPAAPYDEAYRVLLQPDGRVLAWVVESVGQYALFHLARLNPDGSVDTNFDPNLVGYSTAPIGLQPDGRILFGGGYTTQDYRPFHSMTRLNADGTPDAGFSSLTEFGGPISTLAILPDGKVLATGDFITFSGAARNQFVRLNADGSLDENFAPPGPNYPAYVRGVSALAQPPGKMLLWGDFTSFNGTPEGHIVRLNYDGSVDSGFSAGSGPDGNVFCVAQQTNSKIYIAGALTSVNGVARGAIARLMGDPPTITSQPASLTGIVGKTASLTVTTVGPAVIRYQWYRNNVALIDDHRISGATSDSLTIHPLHFSDTGSYTVTAGNDSGAILSEPALLSVTPPK